MQKQNNLSSDNPSQELQSDLNTRLIKYIDQIFLIGLLGAIFLLTVVFFASSNVQKHVQKNTDQILAILSYREKIRNYFQQINLEFSLLLTQAKHFKIQNWTEYFHTNLEPQGKKLLGPQWQLFYKKLKPKAPLINRKLQYH